MSSPPASASAVKRVNSGSTARPEAKRPKPGNGEVSRIGSLFETLELLQKQLNGVKHLLEREMERNDPNPALTHFVAYEHSDSPYDDEAYVVSLTPEQMKELDIAEKPGLQIKDEEEYLKVEKKSGEIIGLRTSDGDLVKCKVQKIDEYFTGTVPFCGRVLQMNSEM